MSQIEAMIENKEVSKGTATLLAVLAWTLIVGSSLAWNMLQEDRQALELATREARTNFNKDQAFRRWGTLHGGVYVRPDERTPPNPYLANVPDRDVLTTDGMRLTLMNPAYMMRQMIEEYEQLFGIKGHITGLVLLNPLNKPDPWEKSAMEHFLAQPELQEVSRVANIDGLSYLRFIRPMYMTEGCVKCHGFLGFKNGELRGGVSVSVPLAPYLASARKHQLGLLISHGGIWLLGLFGILFIAHRSRLRNRERALDAAALRASERRYALAEAGSRDGLWDWDLEHDHFYYSPRWLQMVDAPVDSTPSEPDYWFQRVHPEDKETLVAAVEAHRQGQTDALNCEYRVCDSDGREHWMLARGVAVRDASGRPTRMAGSQTDITEQKELELALAHAATHDPLTELPNRALFRDLVAKALHRSQRQPDYHFGILFLDLDRFKNINDSLGHQAGDRLLREIGDSLQQCVRPQDTVARLGGDEFTVLLEETFEALDAVHVAQRILETLHKPQRIAGHHEVFMSASIGIALSSPSYRSPDELLRDADTAMYRAKAQGKARFEIFDPQMHANALKLLNLETDLRRAVEKQELELDYQPVMNMRTGQLLGFEALVRWRRPHRGRVPPGEFIPLAEDTGVILEIGDWVLNEAGRQMRDWSERLPQSRHLSCAVNLSGRQLMDAELPAKIDHVIAENGLQAERLHLEITETVLLSDPDLAQDMLFRLKKRGIKLSIDDFGTGYSSLSYLHRFPFDTLKIDRTFIQDLGNGNQHKPALTRAIIGMAKELQLHLVAEGVEHQSQVQHLLALDCESAQGFLFHQPLSPAEAEKLIAASQQGQPRIVHS